MSYFSMAVLGVSTYAVYKLWRDGTSLTGKVICICCLATMVGKFIS